MRSSKTPGTDGDARSRASTTDTPRTHPNKRRRTRGGVSGSHTPAKTASSLLFDIPGEVAALSIKHCQPRDFAALSMSCRALHPLIEQALRLRSVEQGYALPQVLPVGDACCHDRVQAILALERQRSQLGRTISAGMSHSLLISPEGALLSCGTEWDHAGNPAPGLVGHGELVETGDTPAQVRRPLPTPPPAATTRSLRLPLASHPHATRRRLSPPRPSRRSRASASARWRRA